METNQQKLKKLIAATKAGNRERIKEIVEAIKKDSLPERLKDFTLTLSKKRPLEKGDKERFEGLFPAMLKVASYLKKDATPEEYIKAIEKSLKRNM